MDRLSKELLHNKMASLKDCTFQNYDYSLYALNEDKAVVVFLEERDFCELTQFQLPIPEDTKSISVHNLVHPDDKDLFNYKKLSKKSDDKIDFNVRIMRCDAMRCDAMRCDAMRCDAMRCDAMRCDAMRCLSHRVN